MRLRLVAKQAALGKELQSLVGLQGLTVILLDTLDFFAGAKDQPDRFMQVVGRHVENARATGASAAAGLFNEIANWIGLGKQAAWPRFLEVAGISRFEKYATMHQDPVRFCSHAGDPPHVEVLAPRS